MTLVLGGARSGKSRFAEELVMKAAAPWTLIATAEALDEDMRARIALHTARRGRGWTVVEAPRDLAVALSAAPAGAVLVDCLTLWLSNVMLAAPPLEAEIDRLLASLASASGPLVVVSNEVGLGVVPQTKLGRDFRDLQGQINARVAALADHVVLIAAGLPLDLKQP
jgi:adenosylcobinamide kinase/adenosylcobinamide-phosphate guanylyltransferase